MAGRPVIYVLAGVNGAGKSSIGGFLLERAGLSWYNPDTFARELVDAYGYDQTQANAQGWQESVRRLEAALECGASFAFETTLGGHTIARKLLEATRTHDVIVWYCGLSSPAQHLSRVRSRVSHGGHDIPEAKIRERWINSMSHLIVLMPHLAHLRVYDNSVEVSPGEAIPDPVLLLELRSGARVHPASIEQAASAPDWIKPALEAAFTLDP